MNDEQTGAARLKGEPLSLDVFVYHDKNLPDIVSRFVDRRRDRAFRVRIFFC